MIFLSKIQLISVKVSIKINIYKFKIFLDYYFFILYNYLVIYVGSPRDGMVDITDLKSVEHWFVPVQVRPRVPSFYTNLGGSNLNVNKIEAIFKKIKETLAKVPFALSEFFRIKHIIMFIVVLAVAVFIIFGVSFIIIDDYFKGDGAPTCIEDIDFSSTSSSKEIKANADLSAKGNYKFEQTTQKASPVSFGKNGIKKTYNPIIIDITNSWTPWFGDYDPNTEILEMTAATPSKHFLCNMQKISLPNKPFGATAMENEYYFIKDYYSNVVYNEGEEKFEYILLDPQFQEPCWLSRGMGLYMGFYGQNGKQQPPHFHHLLATQAVCEIYNFLPEARTIGNSANLKTDYIFVKNISNEYTSELSEEQKEIKDRIKLLQNQIAYIDKANSIEKKNFQNEINNYFNPSIDNLTSEEKKWKETLEDGTIVSANYKMVFCDPELELDSNCNITKANNYKVEMKQKATENKYFIITEFAKEFNRENEQKPENEDNTIITLKYKTHILYARNFNFNEINSLDVLKSKYEKLLAEEQNKLKNNEAETEETKNENNYTVNSFLKENFTVSYYLARDTKYCSECVNSPTGCKDCPTTSGNITEAKEEEKSILSIGSYVVYDIKKHEELLYKYNIRNPGRIIANATNNFMQACYKETYEKVRNINNGSYEKKLVKNLVGKYRFSEAALGQKLYKEYAENNDGKNIEYRYGEIAKFILLDRYYSDNQGGYNLNFISGFLLDDESGSIESAMRTIEYFLLGTPMLKSTETSNMDYSEDRTDGLISKIYHNIITDSFRNFARAVLALYVIVYGFYIIFGLKKVSIQEFIMFSLKIAFLFAIISENGWDFFTRTFINFFVNGVIGIVDMICDIFNKVFSYYSYTDNNIFAFKTDSRTESALLLNLSKNFRFIDNTLDLFFSYAFHVKLLSLVFTYNPIIGALLVLVMYLLIFKYLNVLFGTLIPYIGMLLQVAILLPLAPIFLLFMFFDKTKDYFKKWLNYLASRSFEIIIYFFVLFFATGLINNKFLDFFSYEVCMKGLKILVKESGYL